MTAPIFCRRSLGASVVSEVAPAAGEVILVRTEWCIGTTLHDAVAPFDVIGKGYAKWRWQKALSRSAETCTAVEVTFP